jgi:hypothetical protein
LCSRRCRTALPTSSSGFFAMASKPTETIDLGSTTHPDRRRGARERSPPSGVVHDLALQLKGIGNGSD